MIKKKTIKYIVNNGVEQLNKYSSTPFLDMQVFLQKVLNISKEVLIIQDDRVLTDQEFAMIIDLINKRIQGYSVACLIAEKYFYKSKFFVNEDVLIPRAETEELLEIAINLIKKNNLNSILDLGTGSACIAISLKKEMESLKIVASDISKKALSVARKNATNLSVEISFVYSDLFKSMKGKYFDLIIANLPYIPEDDKDLNIAKEPDLALYSGVDGLDHYRRLAKDVTNYTKYLLIEFSPVQKECLKEIFKNITFYQDIGGQDRFALIVCWEFKK